MPFEEQILIFLDHHRRSLDACLDGLSEEQARRKMMASNTTLLGLVKHATFVERVWFEEAFTGLPRSVLGIEEGREVVPPRRGRHDRVGSGRLPSRLSALPKYR